MHRRFDLSHLENEQRGKFAGERGVPSILKFNKLILPAVASAIALMMVWLYFNSVKSGYAAAENYTSSNLSASLPDLNLQQPIHPDARILSEDDYGITIEFTTPKFEIVMSESDEGPCQLIRLDGFSEISDPGEPRLPVHGAVLGIPAVGDPELNILKAESNRLEGVYNICPGPEPVMDYPIDGPPKLDSYRSVKSSQIYTQNSFLPDQPVKIESTGFIRSQRTAALRFNPFQYNPAAGELRYFPRLVVQVKLPGTASFRKPELAQTDEGIFEDVLKSSLINYDSAREWRISPAAVNSLESRKTPIPLFSSKTAFSQPAYKISIGNSGIYSVTYDLLQAADFPVDSVNPRKLHLYNKGTEVAIEVIGEMDEVFNPSDAILFYGEKFETRFSKTNVYWLTWEDEYGKRIISSSGEPLNSYPVPTSFPKTVHLEKNSLYQSNKPSGPEQDYWYWNYVYSSSPPSSKLYTTTLEFISNEPVNATLRGALYGFLATPRHHTLVSMNSNLVSDLTWPDINVYTFETLFNQSVLVEGTNAITLAVPLDGGITYDYFFTNWFEITYQRLFRASQGELEFPIQAGNWEIHASGFVTSSIQVLDITTATLPVKITDTITESDGAEYLIKIEQTLAEEHKYLAFTPAAIKSPISIELDQASDLMDNQNGADYIFITYGEFITDIQPLADYRSAQGLRVKVVDVQDVYDEFGEGLFHPEAIHDFLAYAYSSWQPPAPTFVLLVGDGDYDFLNNFGWNNINYIPPYLANVDRWIGETAADNRYVSVSGSDFLPDMAIGRLPVRSITDTVSMVGKILEYENDNTAADWKEKVTFIADNADTAGNFAQLSDLIADNDLPNAYEKTKIYFKVNYPTIAAARFALTTTINAGTLLVSYVGHGAVTQWMHENIFDPKYLQTINNPGMYPFFVPMTCNEGYFIYPYNPSKDYTALAERVVKPRSKGGIASFSPSGQGVASGHDQLERGLFQAIFHEYQDQIGLAAMQAKLYLYAVSGGNYMDLIETYHLFGDPATRLRRMLKPDVTIAKTGSQGIMTEAGHSVHFNLTYTNTGDAPATNIVISDTLPAMVVNPVVTASAGTFTLLSEDPLRIEVPDLEPGASEMVTITGSLPGSFLGWLTNSASIQSSGEPVEDLADNRAETSVQIVFLPPDVAISKVGEQGFLTDSGYPVTFRLTYTNQGNGTATDVIISDTLPTALKDPVISTSADSYTTLSTEPLRLQMPDLVPGASEQVTITGIVTETYSGLLSNAAAIESYGEEPSTQADNRAETWLDIVQLRPDLTISKSGTQGRMTEAGHSVTYQLTYTNTGTGPTRNLIISDTLPILFENPVLATSAYSYTLLSTDPLVMQMSELAPGESKQVTVTGSVPGTFLGWLSNAAAIQSRDELEGNLSDNHAENELEIVFIPPDVTISKSGEQGILNELGYPITYRMTYSNNGNGTATTLVISDTFPTQFQDPVVTTSADSYLMLSEDPLRLQMPDLVPGSSEQITITGIVPDTFEGWISNTISIESYGEESSTQLDNRAVAWVEILQLRPDMNIAKSGEQGLTDEYGTDITFWLDYSNIGNGTATSVIVSDTLPMEFIDPIISTSAFSYTQLSAEPLRLQLSNLTPGESERITITGKVSSDFGGWLENAAEVESLGELPLTTYDNRSETSIEINQARPDMAILKEGELGPLDSTGATVAFRLTYSNNGNALAQNVIISDTLPVEFENPIVTTSAYSFTQISSEPLILQMSDLLPDASEMITISGHISSAFQGWLVNAASIQADRELSVLKSDNRADTMLDVVQLRPELSIEKFGKIGTADEMTTSVSYRLIYTNTGFATAANIIVTETLPAEFLNAVVTTDAGSFTQLSIDPLVLQMPDLETGASVMITITGMVPISFVGTLVNTAEIRTSGELESAQGNNHAESLLEILKYLNLPVIFR